MKTKKLIIFGTSKVADVAYEYFTFDSEYDVVAFCVDREFLEENTYKNLPVIASDEIKQKYSPNEYEIFVALNSSKVNYDRTRIYNKFKNLGYKLATYISSKAFVWKNVEIGDNCFILENNTIQPYCKIGNNVTLWSGNHIGHHSVIRDNCFISSQVVIAGCCDIGENTYMAVNSTVADNVKIEKNNFIAMGAIINKSTKPNSLYSNEYAKNMKINTLEYFGVNNE